MTEPFVESLEGAAEQCAVSDGTSSITRGDLKDAAISFAARLREAGVERGDRVAIPATSEIATVVALLGARLSGAIACPFDLRQKATLLPTLSPRAVIARSGADLEIEIQPVSSPPNPATNPEPGWGLSTSGSTGTPKTVILSSSSAEALTEWSAATVGYRPTNRVFSMLPLHHILGLSQIWVCLRARAKLILPTSALKPGDFVEWVREATLLPAIPLFMRWLAQARDKPNLRVVTLGGQPTIPEDRIGFATAFPQTAFFNIYGLTEAFRALWLPPEEFLSRAEATGRPASGMKAWLDDNELWLEGPHVAREYLDDPVRSAERFPRPHTVRTGDLFRLEGDLFFYVGRRDTVFKSYGEKVVPELVERALQGHPAVSKCMVVAEAVGGPEPRPVAYVIAASSTPTPGELRDYLRERLPSAMVPARFTFVTDLPSTPSGKLLRHMKPTDS